MVENFSRWVMLGSKLGSQYGIKSFGWEETSFCKINFAEKEKLIIDFSTLPFKEKKIHFTDNKIIIYFQKEHIDLKLYLNEDCISNLIHLSQEYKKLSFIDDSIIYIIITPYFYNVKINGQNHTTSLFSLLHNEDMHFTSRIKLIPFMYGEVYLNKQMPINTIIMKLKKYKPYYDKIKKINYNMEFSRGVELIATSRDNKIIGGKQYYNPPRVYLPKIPKDNYDSVQVLLEDVLKLQKVSLYPEWIPQYYSNKLINLRNDINEWENKIKQFQDQIMEYHSEIDENKEPLQLLFEKNFELENIVGKVLHFIGIQVTKPSDANIQDWEYISGDVHIVIEVKGHNKSSLKMNPDLREISDFKNRVIGNYEDTDDPPQVKGVLIINYDVKTLPNERGDLTISPTSKNFLEINELAILSTMDLYYAYLLIENGEDPNIIREKLFADLINVIGLIENPAYKFDKTKFDGSES